MQRRKKIGLFYAYNEGWIGGTYYIQNLISAFNALNDEQRPEVLVFTDKKEDFEALIKVTAYPHLTRCDLPSFSLYERIINKVSFLLFKKRIIKYKYPHTDILFPTIDEQFLRRTQKRMFWIPDLQEHFLPEFCTKEEIGIRKTWQQKIAAQNAKILFSSRSTSEDFTNLYPRSIAKNYVVPFAVSHPDYDNVDFTAVKEKYGVTSNYFFAPNQFWAHKNHKVILEAAKILKDGGKDILVLFSGKPNDYRNPGYYDSLTEYVEKNDLRSNIRFLGFIDRAEQLKLMQQAIAVVQPSRFEGWSTVIEDAKAMNQYVIASNIPVHLEQIKSNVRFFAPDDPLALAAILGEAMNGKPEVVKKNYDESIKKFAAGFLDAALA